METQNSPKLKAAIVGCGNIAPMHMQSLQMLGVPVVAVCDREVERTMQYDCPGRFADCGEMLKTGGFDVLHVCLPHYLHAPVTLEAIAHGVHVLCEKPMATTVSDAQRMLAAAEAKGVHLGVIFQNRYNPGTVLVQKALDSGALGKIQGGWLQVTWNRGGDYYAKSDWRGKWATEGGGALINQSIHVFDLMNTFFGRMPDHVEANIANRAHPEIEVEDVAEGVIYYGDVKITFYANTIHPYDAPAELGLFCENGMATITGSSARIQYNDGRTETAAEEEDSKFALIKNYWGRSHARQIQDFYKSLSNDKIPTICGAEALKTQMLINGIYESAKAGERIDF